VLWEVCSLQSSARCGVHGVPLSVATESVQLAVICAGKQAQLLKQGWGDDEKIQDDVLNKFYDAEALAGYPKFVHTNVGRLDETAIDFDLLDDLIRHIDITEDEGAILVFLPGMMEIMGLVDRLQGSHQYALIFHTM
jgi:hypothetical protein